LREFPGVGNDLIQVSIFLVAKFDRTRI
jgi:hypothetical protein